MMPVKPLDTLLAIKVINLAPGLGASDRRVATALIEHFNRKTGRCDPSLQRIAFLLALSTRTIMRSIKRLEEANLFKKVRYGGYFNRNSYQPNWGKFNNLEHEWRCRFKRGSRAYTPDESDTSGQNSHLQGDNGVTQTYRSNLNQLTSATRTPNRIKTSASSNWEVAKTAAERRWTDALHQRFVSLPDVYAEIIEAIDPALRDAATNVEVRHRGAGLTFILERVKFNRVFE